MKERGLIRIIILLSGALLWVAYLFDAVCSRYAIYEVIGYGAHELLSMLPYVSALTTAVWLAVTLVKGERHCAGSWRSVGSWRSCWRCSGAI